MSIPWSRLEVEATVADYFSMLDDELNGRKYNKAEHRRHLMELLSNRTAPAIERKHQNISAVLIELGMVYISGYKPLSNYQRLLKEVVTQRLNEDRRITDSAMEQVSATASLPEVEDILKIMVSPPSIQTKPIQKNRSQAMPRRKVNYLEIEAQNRSLGLAGEAFVVRYEMARLIAAGKDSLAAKVEHVAETVGDGLGYDVLSFDEDGKERFIEVKTTAYGQSTPFYITRNELAVSVEKSAQYHLYRAYGFRHKPRMFWKQGSLDTVFSLQPSQYLASIA